MMKNTEWGAVAYLQHSAYGSRASVRINNNSSYITGYAAKAEPTCGNTNTNEACNIYEQTNIGANGENTFMYNTSIGYLASTTGNISGIYDMSGGTWEYVMGIMSDQEGRPLSGRNDTYNSGFRGKLGCPSCDDLDGNITEINGIEWPEKKYYDLYPYGNNASLFKNRILGDATGELGPFGTTKSLALTVRISSWYNDDCWGVGSQFPWFRRSGPSSFGNNAGIFYFGSVYGMANAGHTFRVVLAP